VNETYGVLRAHRTSAQSLQVESIAPYEFSLKQL